MKFDAVIIGGGIVGTACAMQIAKAGLSVSLVESDFVGSGTTAAGMGHLVVMDDSEPQFALTSFSRELWRNAAAGLPRSCEFEHCGTIWIAADEAEMSEANRKAEYYHEHGIAAETIGPERLYALEPNLGTGLLGGLLVNEDCVTYQPAAALYFMNEAVAAGAELRQGLNVDRIEGDELTLSDGSKISAGRIINAAGVAAGQFSPEIEIVQKKGHLVITDRYPNYVTHQLVELGYLKSAHSSSDESVAFNIQPRVTGQLLIGSSRQPGLGDRRVDDRIVDKMLNRAFDYMPGIREMSALRIWTGSRPATSDNLPYIGPSTTNPSVIIAAGHEGLGITTSLGTAELVVDEIMGRESSIPRAPYLPSRMQKK